MPERPDDFSEREPRDPTRPVPTSGRRTRPSSRADDDAITVDTRHRSGRRRAGPPPPRRPRERPVYTSDPDWQDAVADRPPYRYAADEGRPGDHGDHTRAIPLQGPTRAAGPAPPADPQGPAPDRGPQEPRGQQPRRRRRVRNILLLLLVLVVAYVGSLVWAAASAWNQVDRVAAVPVVDDRPAAGTGRNVLLVGSDGRELLSAEERRQLGTGNTEGERTDSIMLVHLPDDGEPTMLSIPRDSYVPIRDHGTNKINASFSFGGPQLLVDTVEQNTGLRVDGYLQIGFGGFVSVVDSLGGIEMCLDAPMQDERAHIDLPAGCQVLDGVNSLGYVRARYSDPQGDLGRVERQREFLAALTREAAAPANVLIPWRLHDIGSAAAQSITVDEEAGMVDTAELMLAIRAISNDQGQSVTVPVSDNNLQTHAGSAVAWDEAAAAELFEALRTDAPLSIDP